MDLIQWWVGTLILVTAVALGAVAWRAARPGRVTGTPVLASSLDRIRALPLFRTLARREWRLRLLETVALAVALAGVALLASRLVGVSDDSEEMRTREVVLCLDVSGSMKEVDADVVDAYRALAEELDEERIGLVVFDAYAVTVFPLTSDRDYIADQLQEVGRSVRGEVAALPGVSSGKVGSSLIGDGLATCTRNFDQLDTFRSRTVVLATDNEVAGDVIYTLPQAAAMAEEAGVMVFAIMPAGAEEAHVEEMRTAVATTAGDVLAITAGESANVARIASEIKAQQKTAIMAMAQDRSFDRIVPGAVLLLLGLAGALIAVWRRR
ncbi:VWA domain-containing protein [Nocardioides alcanivorans]|uniref:VWA domain-containing protein n=1 Tax=Nocardioides alcanivorans TaxID=2897352 RepID=UPI001F21DDF1|nr:VWA domain-containing protein [Nocardioides alcanivorans]